jgi:hypothetical protein
MRSSFPTRLGLGLALAGLTGVTRGAGETAPGYPFPVAIEVGASDFSRGDSISIAEVRGTQATIVPNGTYCVTGTYNLASRDKALLSLFMTAANSGWTPIGAQQQIRVSKGTGQFRLIATFPTQGYLHLSFYPIPSGESFGTVYFGQGAWVLRELWGHSSAPHSSPAGPNQALFDFLGEPVAPPQNLNPAYSNHGLFNAVSLAAMNGGVKLSELIIDDSEFPFIVGVVCPNGDYDKLVAEIKKMQGYQYGGSVSNSSQAAFNIVPRGSFPPEDRERISRRMVLRYQVLFHRLQSGRSRP